MSSKTTFKHLGALLLSLAVVCALLPAVALADPPTTANVSFCAQDEAGKNIQDALITIKKQGGGFSRSFLLEGDTKPLETLTLEEGTYIITQETTERSYKLPSAPAATLTVNNDGTLSVNSTQCNINGNTLTILNKKLNPTSKQILWDSVEPDETYIITRGKTDTMLRISDVSSFSNYNIGYCLNRELDYPVNEEYQRIENGFANPAVVKALLSKYDDTVNIPELQKQVQNILYAGYPHDGIGLQENAPFRYASSASDPYSDEEFEFYTQSSLWVHVCPDRNSIASFYTEVPEVAALALPPEYEMDVFIPKNRNSSSQNIIMMVKKQNFSILKTDENDTPLSGASFTLLDGSGNPVETWISSEREKAFTLRAGTYTLQENTPPINYEALNDVSFAVNTDGTITIDNNRNSDIKVEDGKIIVRNYRTQTDPAQTQTDPAPAKTSSHATSSTTPQTGDTSTPLLLLTLLGLTFSGIASIILRVRTVC